ncbi:MAG: TonB-dependent receptor [Bacteroidales bacterium]|nr:TonB-dependent receptor [Bacteroidales bacterium]MDT8430640.1 TonB-dependent receptor [Bacteroidales bacterium]
MKQILSILFILLVTNTSGQQLRILSENSSEPIANVAIFNTSRERAAITDSNGYTGTLAFLKGDTLVFQHPSYNTVIYPYEEIRNKQVVRLSKRNILFDEFVISATKSRESKQILPYKVSVLREKNLVNNPAQTAADILLETGNIAIQKTQAGGGSPILRGFEANKILLVADGVRMNNAIYRSGHLQNAITIDHAILERTEIIFGPSSLIYGSDALGGVIHYYTKDPELSESEKIYFSGSAYTQYSTANTGKVGHIDFNAGGKKIGSLTSVTYKDFENIRIGSNRNLFYGDWGKTLHYVKPGNDGRDSMYVNQNELIQRNTAYQQFDLLQKFKYAQSEFVDWILNIQYSTSSDIDRLDNLNDYDRDGILKYAEYYYGPQNRLLASVKNVNRNDNPFFTNATSIFAYQRINEDRISRKFKSNDRLHQLETVNVLSLNIDFLKVWDVNKKLNYGYDLIYNHVGSGAFYEHLSTSEIRPAQTRYPSGGSNTYSSSIYASYKKIFSDKLVLNGGLRYNFSHLNSVFNNPALEFDTTRFSNGALTGSLSLVYHPGPAWQINGILSSGYRNPNVDDYGKIRAKDDYIIIPNPDIKPEYTYNAETGVSRVIEGFLRMDIVGYYTLITNAIVRTDYTLNGQDSMMYDGDIYRVSANYNANLGHIYGASVNVISDFYNNIVLKGSINYTRGRNLTDDVPLGHIPPVFGRVSITYDYKKFRFDSFVHYNGWKFADSFSPYGEDNEEEATMFGYPSWWTLNMHTSYRINEYITAQFAIENILDQFYKPFASGVSAPGRNFTLTLRTHF